MVGNSKQLVDDEVVEPTDICPNCGSKMLVEDGVLVCPHCHGDIDYFGDSPS